MFSASSSAAASSIARFTRACNISCHSASASSSSSSGGGGVGSRVCDWLLLLSSSWLSLTMGSAAAARAVRSD